MRDQSRIFIIRPSPSSLLVAPLSRSRFRQELRSSSSLIPNPHPYDWRF